MTHDLNTQQKGIVTELEVATYLLRQGYNVSQPLSQHSKYDLIVDVHGHLLKLQVKTARMDKSGEAIEFNCKSTTTNSSCVTCKPYTKEEIDYFATYWNNAVYMIPVGECSSMKHLHLTRPRCSNWSYIDDYSAERILGNYIADAGVAQSVEHLTSNQDVAGS